MTASTNSDIDTIINSVELSVRSSLSGLPGPLRIVVEPIVKRNLKILAKKIKVPRIALYGRAGSGKSSVINALMGGLVAEVGVAKPTTSRPESYEYQQDGWVLHFVDSRGVGDSSDGIANEQAIKYIVKERVDVLLFVIPVDERGYVPNDISFLTSLKDAHKREYEAELPIILVLNKIDRVPPPGEWSPPYNLNVPHSSSRPRTVKQAKETNVLACIRARTDEYKSLTSLWVAICASWDDYDDRRYNIDELALTIYDNIPDEAKPGFAGATAISAVKKAVARTLTWTSALVAGATCFIPIPGVDALAMLAMQASLVSMIARIGSSNQDKNRVATKFIQNLGIYGAGVTFATLANQLAKFIPVAGMPITAVAAATVTAITVALGEAASNHFIEGISMEETKKMFDSRNRQMRDKLKNTFKDRNAKRAAKDLNNIFTDITL